MRDVALSRRLLAALSDLYEVRFHPSPDALILQGTDASNFRKRQWRRICERAGLGHRSIKDLRDTYASQLLMAGISIGYISRQLGHAGTQITSEHYAKWLSEDYVEPMALEPGEVPADLLARLSFRQLRQSASTGSGPKRKRLRAKSAEALRNLGAGNGSRTRDPQLGKLSASFQIHQ